MFGEPFHLCDCLVQLVFVYIFFKLYWKGMNLALERTFWINKASKQTMSATEHGNCQTVALKLEIVRLYLEINEVHKHS